METVSELGGRSPSSTPDLANEGSPDRSSSGLSSPRFDLLRFRSGREWRPLPEWAIELIQQGYSLAGLSSADLATTLAIALPTASFAALFVATGYRLALMHQAAGATEADGQFEKFAELQSGTALYVISGTRRIKGIYEGCVEVYGERRLKVLLQSPEAGGGRRYFSAKQIGLLQVSPKDFASLPAKQSGDACDTNWPFLETIIPGVDPGKANQVNRAGCVVIGNITRTRAELTTLKIGVESDQRVVRLDLPDFLSVGFGTGSGAVSGGVSLLSARWDPSGVFPSSDFGWPLSIFDGSRSYLDWRMRTGKGPQAVLLDWTDSDFDQATEVLDNAYITRRETDTARILEPLPSFQSINFRRN